MLDILPARTNPHRSGVNQTLGSPVDSDRLVRDVQDFDGDAHLDWMLNSSFRLMHEGDLVWFYAAGNADLYALAYVKRVYVKSSAWRLEVVWDVEITELLETEPIACRQAPQSVQRANAATRQAISAWNRKRSDYLATRPATFMFEEDVRTRDIPSLRRLAAGLGRHVDHLNLKAEILEHLLESDDSTDDD